MNKAPLSPQGIQNIPKIKFENRHNKAFEFQFVSNREILLNNLPHDHDPFLPHRVHFYALLFILEGSGKHFIDFKSYDYQKGSVIFISKDQVQTFEKNFDRDAYFMIFTENFLERSSMASNLMQQLSLYNYHLYPPVLHLKEDEIEIFKDLVFRIRDEYHAPDDELTEEVIQSLLKIFLCLAERIRKKNRAALPPSKYQPEFLQFQKLLNQHLWESRMVKFYADLMLISTKKLNRITQDTVQQPAKNYINDMLILEIKRLLMNTSLSIKEIAFRSGFEEATNFVKYFKKYTQKTPSEFRKSYGK